MTFANLVFIGLDREHVTTQCALIEGALEAKPMLVGEDAQTGFGGGEGAGDQG